MRRIFVKKENIIYKTPNSLLMVDLTDKKLLYEVFWDCRQTHTQLAKKLRVSKQVVSYRIAQLEKQKILVSYHALIDWRKLGYSAIRIYWKWQDMTPQDEEEFYKYVRNDPLFMWSVKFEGEIDIGYYVWVKTIPEFAKKWFEILSRVRKNILKQEIYESVAMVHYPMKPLVDRFIIDEKVLGLGKEEQYDDTDYELLRAVTEYARMPLVDLAQRISLTPKAALYRLKALEKKGIIMGYQAFIDTDLLGYRFYKVDYYLKSMQRLSEMYEFAKNHANIVYVMRTIGGPDYEIEVMVRDVVELNKIINEIRNRFADVIQFHRHHRFEYTLKRVYLPGEKIRS